MAIILDRIRPYRPYSAEKIIEESPELEEEIVKNIREQSAFVYWDSQNPLYVSLISVGLPIILFATAAITWFATPWAAVLTFVVGLILIIPYGGQRTMVTRDSIIVRWGIVGIRVLKLQTTDITGVELHEFAPLKDFGGYGIRINREMIAYYLRGNRGVKITRRKGKAVLIGSDRPEALYTILKVISET